MELSRRKFLRSAAVGVAVVGWSSRTGWVTAADAAHCSFDDFPRIDGVLLTDDASRSFAAEDYGHIIRRTPCAVLRPGSTADIAKTIRFARERGIKVSMRGQGSSSYGQAQVEDGILIDSATLARIVSIDPSRAVVEPGVQWRTLILEALARGVTPPVLTDYQDLTVGGTLSLGGIQAGPMPSGAQVDNVLELDVVTGAGDLVTCSDQTNPDLFNAVLAGLGQCGIIVRATIPLVRAPKMVAYVSLEYTDLQKFVDDQLMLARENRFTSLGGRAAYKNGGWVYTVDAAAYLEDGQIPDEAQLLQGLQGRKLVVAPMPYAAWPFRADHQIAARKADGSWFGPHVWFLGLMPATEAHAYLQWVFSEYTDADVGGGAVLLGVLGHEHVRRPLYKTPDGPFAFGLLLSRQLSATERIDEDKETRVNTLLEANRFLYDRLVSIGGKRYPTDAIPHMSRDDWVRHFGPSWGFLTTAKARYDPGGILGSGVGIF